MTQLYISTTGLSCTLAVSEFILKGHGGLHSTKRSEMYHKATEPSLKEFINAINLDYVGIGNLFFSVSVKGLWDVLNVLNVQDYENVLNPCASSRGINYQIT